MHAALTCRLFVAAIKRDAVLCARLSVPVFDPLISDPAIILRSSRAAVVEASESNKTEEEAQLTTTTKALRWAHYPVKDKSLNYYDKHRSWEAYSDGDDDDGFKPWTYTYPEYNKATAFVKPGAARLLPFIVHFKLHSRPGISLSLYLYLYYLYLYLSLSLFISISYSQCIYHISK